VDEVDRVDEVDEEDVGENGETTQGHPNVRLRRGWREAPGDVKPRTPGFLTADPTLCHSERSEESNSSAGLESYSTHSAPCVIPSAAKNPFVALEKGDSHHFLPQPAPLKE
jgi:hypothetical protein